MIRAILVALMVLSTTPQAQAQVSLSGIAARDREATVFISSEYFDRNVNAAQPGPSGSGFIVSEDGYVLTATHLVQDWLGQSDENRKKYALVGRIGTRYASTAIEMTVVAADVIGDYTLLRFKDSVKKYQPAPVCFDGPPLLNSGDPIFALGFPGERDFSPVAGSYSNDNNQQSLFEVSAPFSPGMSGGPVYNRNGLVVGIVQGGYPNSETTRFVIPVRWARSWLQDRANVASGCSSTRPIDTSVPGEQELCARLKEVIKAAGTGFRQIMIGGRYIEGGFNSAKIILPSARFCVLNQSPVFGRSPNKIYYSCMLFSDEKDDRVASARLAAYTEAISKCLAPVWVAGGLETRQNTSQRTFTRNSDSANIGLRVNKGNDGNDLALYVNPN